MCTPTKSVNNKVDKDDKDEFIQEMGKIIFSKGKNEKKDNYKVIVKKSDLGFFRSIFK